MHGSESCRDRVRADIHNGQELQTPMGKGRITDAQDPPSIFSHSACNARPVHTVGSKAVLTAPKTDFRSSTNNITGQSRHFSKSAQRD